MLSFLTLGSLALTTVAMDTALRDYPIETSGSITYLDGTWTATSSSTGPINATVPGDIITDLQMAKVIPDPYLDITWLQNSKLWHNQMWTYSKSFTLSAQDSSTMMLVFDGVKMAATVSINSHVVGIIRDQFLRYTFDLSTFAGNLVQGENANVLEVKFDSDQKIPEDGRFMACTGGWDWAPYSNTITNSSGNTTGPASTFSKGIWKSVYIVEVPQSSVAITHITPHTRYLGSYPTKPLEDGSHGGFDVNVTVHFMVPSGGASGSFSVAGSWTADGNSKTSVSSQIQSFPAGENQVSLTMQVTAAQIKLWWPAGVGAQPLYNVSVTYTPASATTSTSVTAVRRLGFRVFALVTVNDTDAAYITANASADGTDKHGMFFRVNGAAVYSRGANMVPMDELEGRLDSESHRILVKSSADAGMNTLRVWGGGIFYPGAFYDACDEYGVMIYHDMQFNGNTGPHTPVNTSMTQANELRHQIRRLSHHPSIVLWDSCNECVVTPNTSSIVYATFVMTIVAQEDRSRVVWPSSPGPGWVTGVNRLYVTPNENNLTVHGGGHIWNQGIETHAPYQLGSGWPAVNSGQLDSCFDNAGTGNGVMVPNQYTPGGPGGVAYKNLYASEFGTGGSSSFESMAGTLSPSHWGLHGGMAPDTCADPDACLGLHNCTGNNPMAQRNYACDGQIHMYWGNSSVNLDATGEAAFKGQTYQCQLIQAFVLKQVYEYRRTQNQFGHLVWMLNEIWPTVGWGSLEYGPPPGFTSGQVRGGRWKPLHYFYKQSLMTDVMATCGAPAKQRGQKIVPNITQCFVSNHRPSRMFNGTVTLTSYEHFGDGTGKVIFEKQMSLAEGPGPVEWFNVSTINGNKTATISTVKDEEGNVISEHMIQLVRPNSICVPAANVSFKIADKPNADGTVDITVVSDKVALWVTLTTYAQGRFSDNAFFLPATTKTIQYIPMSSAVNDFDVLKQSLRIEDFSMYRPTNACQ
eukprot:m.2498 g.2498  ORF g.2498 m.2498 type:complete len:975 (-) comp2531_c0_seq1:113-3037(-)